MKLKLHHINLCTTNVPAMDEFYRSVLGLDSGTFKARGQRTSSARLPDE